jgi:hypothetical protein
MCDYNEGDFEEVELVAEDTAMEPQPIPIIVVKRRK